MSSSKVFKQDPHFTPTPLVQRNIDAVHKEAKPHLDVTGLQPPPGGPPKEIAVAPPPYAPVPVVEPVTEPVTPVDIEAIKQEAYNLGMADLAAQFQADFQQTLAAFAEGCQKFDSERKKMLQQSRGDLINLIILLSEKILGQELATPRNIIATTLQSALEQAIESEEYYVIVHPEDLAFAEAKAPDVIAAIRGLERIVFKTDGSMARGGCLLESSEGTVDATIETQLASMKEFLAEQPIFPPPSEIHALLPPDQQPTEGTNPEV